MHGLESLRFNDSTAEAARSCHRRGFRLAAGTHRLGHGRIDFWWKSNMRHGLVRSDAHNFDDDGDSF